MKKTLPLFLLLTCLSTLLFGQRKRDLIDQIDTLELRLERTESLLRDSKKLEASLGAKVLEYEKQLESSRATNASLLETLTRITEESRNHTESIGQALEELRRKEGQVQYITDALTRADSITIRMLSNLKQAMGQNTSISLENNVLTVTVSDRQLFDGDSGQQLVGTGKNQLLKLAEAVKKAPGSQLVIQNFQDPGKTQEAVMRALVLAQFLQLDGDVQGDRIRAIAQPGQADSLGAITRISIRPDFEKFFSNVKDRMKQGRGF